RATPHRLRDTRLRRRGIRLRLRGIRLLPSARLGPRLHPDRPRSSRGRVGFAPPYPSGWRRRSCGRIPDVTNVVAGLLWRGLVQDTTGLEELREHLGAGPATFYVGFDPTAASLHLGHLMQVVTARRLQLAGHRPLLLVGGATGQIGDPKESGERVLNSP